MSSYRSPRRTRIYGANYDIGESYYKKQLDDLDHKQGISSRFTDSHLHNDYVVPREEKLTPKVSFLNDAEDEDIYKFTPVKSLRARSYLDDLDDEAASLNLRSSFASKFDSSEGVRFGDDIRKGIFKKTRDILGRDSSPFTDDIDRQAQEGYTSRRLKIKSETLFSNERDTSAVDAASFRAKASKARLADLESEMLGITEKQNERAKRNTSIRKLLNESESDTLTSMKQLTM